MGKTLTPFDIVSDVLCFEKNETFIKVFFCREFENNHMVAAENILK
jgi:hypothetical protein